MVFTKLSFCFVGMKNESKEDHNHGSHLSIESRALLSSANFGSPDSYQHHNHHNQWSKPTNNKNENNIHT